MDETKLTKPQKRLLAFARAHPKEDLCFSVAWQTRFGYVWLAKSGKALDQAHIRTAQSLARKGFLEEIDFRKYRLTKEGARG